MSSSIVNKANGHQAILQIVKSNHGHTYAQYLDHILFVENTNCQNYLYKIKYHF